MIEKEIKIKLSEALLKRLISRLFLLKATKEFCVKQVTSRLDTPNSDLAARGIFLRTRIGESNTVTLKRKILKNDESVKSREEIEADIPDKQQLKILNRIFKLLGFNFELTMEKYRMQWFFGGCKIAIDELSFGFFVEIEGDKKKIFRAAQDLQLNIKNISTGTYWDLFEIYKKKYHIKDQKNIIFPSSHRSLLMKLDRR